jgi:hypothetical protein
MCISTYFLLIILYLHYLHYIILYVYYILNWYSFLKLQLIFTSYIRIILKFKSMKYYIDLLNRILIEL